MKENGRTRRRFLRVAGAGGLAGAAGCSGFPGGFGGSDGGDGGGGVPPLSAFRGSGPLVTGRPAPGGTDIAELSDLEGTLRLYLGGGEGGIYLDFVSLLEDIYPDFEVRHKTASSSSLAQTVIEEVDAGAPQADVFWSIDAGSLGVVADAEAYTPLPEEVVEPVPSSFVGQDRSWVGIAGRARSIPYNTDALSADAIPTDVQQFPDAVASEAEVGWAPTYGAFKAFVTAMRTLRGDEATKEWLRAMLDAGVSRYPNEFLVSGGVADGDLAAGFANHYYAMRVKAARPDAPIELAFTKNDAGALVNVAGALVVEGTEKETLAANFVRHLLSAQAQEFFATVAYSYPMIGEVAPVGELPRIDELEPPDLDLSELSNLQPTLDLMREVGVL
jgi:iron(III) transport system substrate-binding protein